MGRCVPGRAASAFRPGAGCVPYLCLHFRVRFGVPWHFGPACLVWNSKAERPFPTPSFSSSRPCSETPSLGSRHLNYPSPPFPLLYFRNFIALNPQRAEHRLALAGAQGNIYGVGKFIENLESHEFCISAHLILGVTE